MPTSDIHRNRLLAVLAFLLSVAALRASYPVTMPLAFALVVIAALWPLKPALDRVLPPWASYAAMVLVLLSVLLGFAAAVYFSVAQVVRAFAQDWAAFGQLYNQVVSWADRQGIPLGQGASFRRVVGFIQQIVSYAYSAIVYIGFIGILVILGLPEVPAFRRKLHSQFHRDARREVIDAVETIAGKIRSYLGVTTVTSLLTGVSSAAFSFAVGLDLALVWGVLNFLLNFVPVIGNLVGIVPPALYALIQFDGYVMPLVVFIGFAVIQLVISNFVYPMLQGHSLSLSPVAIVIALAFWSWIWGIAGALIAVPLTAASVIVCEHFPSTQWIAKLLSKG